MSNTREYNYMDDETFFTKADIPLPFEDVRQYEHDIAMRPLGEQRYGEYYGFISLFVCLHTV